MNIYDKKETNFNNNGYGFLTPSEALITEELNGEYSLNFTIVNGMPLYEHIVEENIVKVKGQLFRIKTIKKDLLKTEVYAPHIFYDLLNNIVLNTQPTDLTAMGAFQWAMDKAAFETPFTVSGVVEGINTARYVRRNLVEVLMGDMENTIATRWNCEIERNNFNINLVDRIGQDNNVKLIIGKNIKEIDIVIDTVDVVTRMLPLGFDALMLPEIYVDSPNIDLEDIKIKKVNFDVKYDPEDEDAFHTKEEAWDELRNQAQNLFEVSKIDQPTISIKVDWVELSKTEEYKNYAILERANLGDDISVEVAGLSYKTRVLKTVYNVLTDRIDTFEIGSLRASLNYDMTKRFEDLQTQVDKIKPTSILENAKNEATDLINNAMGGYVLKTNEELYIMDTDDINTATKVWRWNLNGLGYSSNGFYGDYELAMTANGEIVADFITTGTMSAQRIEGLQEIITDILSIKATQRNGDNLIRNSAMKNGIEYWFKEAYLLYAEQQTPPENPQTGRYWYVTDDFQQYKKGTMYQWNGTEWIETDKKRSDFDETFLQNFKAEENDESRRLTISNSIITINSKNYGDLTHNFGMTQEIPLEETQEYLTLSLKLNNQILAGNIHIGVGFVPNLLRTQPAEVIQNELIENIYEEWYCVTPDEYTNIGEIKITIKIPKAEDLIEANLTEPEEGFWLDNGQLFEKIDDEWVRRTKIPVVVGDTIWTWREFYSSYYPTNFTREDFKANYAYFAIAHYPRI